ncbi:MAG: hypothetical protein L6420_02480 [Elusimicrobia bacterium]|nr:hypothetical protein [Elusimicrobiota bacterium]
MTGIIKKIKNFFKKKEACKVDKSAQPAGERKTELQKEPALAEKSKE